MSLKMSKFSKSAVGSTQLNELMLRYAQDGQIANVAGCLLKGADVNYKQGALLLIAIYNNNKKILKLLMSYNATLGFKEAINIAEKMEDDKLLQVLNEYVAKRGIEV